MNQRLSLRTGHLWAAIILFLGLCLLAGAGPAGRIVAAVAPAGSAPGKQAQPRAYGGTDVNTVTGTESFPHVTQAGSMVAANGSTYVVTYNDSADAPTNYAGIAYSTNSGGTWTRIRPSPFVGGHGVNFGDPVVAYNTHLNLWVAAALVSGCGSQGIGLWISPDGITWTPGPCAATGTQDDRPSLWVDNTLGSPFFGRMYLAWTDLSTTTGALQLAHADTVGSWSAPLTLDDVLYLRNGQVSGSPNGNGAVYVSAHTQSTLDDNYVYRSLDGGLTATRVALGSFTPAGDGNICAGAPGIIPIWRHPEGGQLAVGPPTSGLEVLHYVYAAHGAGSDGGDIYYQRSTDQGTTWSAPIQLNTDGGTRAQWQPAIAATSAGGILVTWYDRRNTTDNINYQYYGRISTDNGSTWQTEQAISDVLIPQPQQVDNTLPLCFGGDYNYPLAVGNTILVTWTDGRNALSGTNQEDVYFDKVDMVLPTATPTSTVPPTATATPPATATPSRTPNACTVNYTVATASGSLTTGLTDTGNHCDDCVTQVVLPFPYFLYGVPYTTANVSSNGNLQFLNNNSAFANTCLPNAAFGPAIFVHWTDLLTINSPVCPGGNCGIYTTVSGTAPNRTFDIEWRARYYSTGGGSYVNFEIRLYEGANHFDLLYGSGVSGLISTVGVQDAANLSTQYVCNGSGNPLSSGLVLAFTQTCASPTPTASATGTPTATRTATPTATLSATPSSTPTACPGGATWQIGPSAAGMQVNGLAVAGSNDIWAVGSGPIPTDTATASQPLTAHWDGTAWSNLPNPNLGSNGGALQAVAAVAPNDVWAVGSYNNNGIIQTVAEHWNGSAWSLVASPNAGTGDNALASVAAVGPSDVWAAGSYHPTNGGVAQNLILHWNGSTWSIVASPNTGTRDNALSGVAAVAANDVWAVGYYLDSLNTAQTRTLHWDGSSWGGVASPNTGGGANYLTAVYAPGAGDVWAAGYYTAGGLNHTLTLHWTGGSWTAVSSPSPGTADNRFTALAAGGSADVWAVGYYRNSGTGTPPTRTLVAHWDGSAWSTSASPNTGNTANELQAVAVAATSAVWAAGYDLDPNTFSPRSLMLRYTCLPASATPTPTLGAATATPTPTLTNTAVAATATAVAPTPTATTGMSATPTPPGATLTATRTPAPFSPTATATAAAPTGTPTPLGPSATATTAAPTGTPTPLGPSATATAAAPTGTPTPLGPSATATVPVPTGTPTPLGATATATAAAPTGTPTPLGPSATATPRNVTQTALPASATATPTGGATPSVTGTPPALGPSATPAPSNTPTASATPCSLNFSDVLPADYFYAAVQYLACHGVISGYSDGSFRPYNQTTRGQMVKIVVLGFAKPASTPPAGAYTFADVPPTQPFFSFVETAAALNVVSGYICGSPGEPCDSANRPYFRPNADVTRGQLSKIVVGTAGWPLRAPAAGSFADVLSGTAFYPFVETAACYGIVSGYSCGAPDEPCDSTNRPYFRQYNRATRGQIAKIVYFAVTSPGSCPP